MLLKTEHDTFAINIKRKTMNHQNVMVVLKTWNNSKWNLNIYGQNVIF